MVILQVFTAPANELRGREARKRHEVANHVRLIEVAAIEGELGPVARCRSARERQGALKALNASEQLWRHADFRRKYLDQTPPAQAQVGRNLADAKAAMNVVRRIRRKVFFMGASPATDAMRLRSTCHGTDEYSAFIFKRLAVAHGDGVS